MTIIHLFFGGGGQGGWGSIHWPMAQMGLYIHDLDWLSNEGHPGMGPFQQTAPVDSVDSRSCEESGEFWKIC